MKYIVILVIPEGDTRIQTTPLYALLPEEGRAASSTN